MATLPVSDGSRPGHPVDRVQLNTMGFRPLALRVRGTAVAHPEGIGAAWDTIGPVPDAPGIYLFTVAGDGWIHVTYVGQTEHLWMVTKGRLPDGRPRQAQRYGGTLKHLGQTRRRINILLAAQMRLGRTAEHWVLPLAPLPGDDAGLRAVLREREEDLILLWHLRESGWNRG